jgi:hypothetical protein
MAGGPVRQLCAGVDFIPQLEIYEFSYWVAAQIFKKDVRVKICPMKTNPNSFKRAKLMNSL